MRILVVGGGGREHALAWKLSQEASVVWTPANPGIASMPSVKGFSVPASDADGILELCRNEAIDLVVVGPEDPLIGGLADHLRQFGFAVYGPGAAGARLEGSKAFCKEVMQAAGVPTARYENFFEADMAREYATSEWNEGRPVVIKASGAALGKGVVVPASLEEALDAIDMMMVRKELGDAGDEIVIEQRLTGFEFSLLTIVSGTHYQSLPVAQDYKRAHDGDAGPNTGGMGTYSPVASVPLDLVRRTEKEIVEPVLFELAKRGIDYRGTLFAGLMVQDGDPYCLEFNVRFGDPETQSVMRRLGTGFAAAAYAAAQGLAIPSVEVLDNAVVTVVMASQGYPGAYAKGSPISLPEVAADVVVFHAGTALQDGQLVSNGGRVLGVSVTASDVASARARAYEVVGQVNAPGLFFRSDIAARG